MSEKDIYRSLCDERPVPLFCQAWWMDAVCGECWDVCLYEEKGRVVAAQPYHYRRRLGRLFIVQPQLTQYNGVWIDYASVKDDYYEKLALEKRACDALADRILALHPVCFVQSFHKYFTNWLPYYWRGFTQTTRYSYVIDDLSDPESIAAGFQRSKRRWLKKAINKGLYADLDLSGDELFDFHVYALSLQGRKISHSREFFRKVTDAAKARGQGQVLGIREPDGKLVAGIFFVWDGMSGYQLIDAIDRTSELASEASTLAVWECIKFLKGKTAVFDFEGSMDKDIESSFCKYNTRQIQFMTITRYSSPFWEILMRLKNR